MKIITKISLRLGKHRGVPYLADDKGNIIITELKDSQIKEIGKYKELIK